MRVLLATYGTRGDVEPIVALAAKLQSDGADVQVCAPSDGDFVDLHARHGVPLVPFAKAWRSWATEASSAEEKVFDVDQYVSGYIEATYETLVRAALNADVLIASGMLHFAASSAAEVAGIPHRFVAFSPSVLEPQPWQAHIVPAIDRHRASIGLPPIPLAGNGRKGKKCGRIDDKHRHCGRIRPHSALKRVSLKERHDCNRFDSVLVCHAAMAAN